MAESLLFWFLAMIILMSALGVLFFSNPIYAAFCLIMTMVGISALFATLGADFIAGVQLIVYAGAVLVLFVMVLMLFDLKSEIKSFSKGFFTNLLKIIIGGLILGIMLGVLVSEFSAQMPFAMQLMPHWSMTGVKKLGELLFTEYMLIFQILGILLLVVAVGVVALARAKGGTHERV